MIFENLQNLLRYSLEYSENLRESLGIHLEIQVYGDFR